MKKKYINYYQYIQSDTWKKKVARKKKLVGNKCQCCGAKTRLTGHHRTYERLGRERMSDIWILCWTCHKWLHRWLNLVKWVKKYWLYIVTFWVIGAIIILK